MSKHQLDPNNVADYGVKNCIINPTIGPSDFPYRTTTDPRRPGTDTLSQLITARMRTEKDMSDKELDQELRRLQDEKDRRDTLKYFIRALEEVLGESEDINGLKALLTSGASEAQLELLKTFVQSVRFQSINDVAGSET